VFWFMSCAYRSFFGSTKAQLGALAAAFGPQVMASSSQERVDSLLCELEDILREERAQGRPVKSLSDFLELIRRAAAEVPAEPAETKVLKSHHGRFWIAKPDGRLDADSQKPNGDWEKFQVLPSPLGDDQVVIKTFHGRYVRATSDGRLLADSRDPKGEAEQFEILSLVGGRANIQTCEGRYVIALPDGSLRADSSNPTGDWEEFEIIAMDRDCVCDRENLFKYLDELSAAERRFDRLTHTVHEWTLGGVVRLKHHGCVLTEGGGQRFLKFDFGRWGVGWSLLDKFPENPKGTCLVEEFEIAGDPQRVKQYLSSRKAFSWLGNNCSTFSRGLMLEFCAAKESWCSEIWPEWSHCLASPPLKMPCSRNSSKGTAATGATEPPQPQTRAEPLGSSSSSVPGLIWCLPERSFVARDMELSM